MSPPFQSETEVLASEALTEDIYRLTLRAPDIAAAAQPGQFVMLRVTAAGHDPLLRRPFSIALATAGGEVHLLYKVVGRGTRLMTTLRPGDPVGLVGPLGQGFRLEKGKSRYLIGGGLGAAPLLFLSHRLLEEADGEPPLVLLGARHREELAAITADFEAAGLEIVKATDDGSAGHHGYVVDLLPTALEDSNQGGQVYSCGPYPMLRAVAQLCHLRGWACQVSLETMMACGLAACLGCALPRAGLEGYVHVCKDGPVFEAGQVAWF